MRQIYNFFVKTYIRFRGNDLFLRAAIRKARRLHCRTGRRYRVFFFGYRYRVWTRADIRQRIKSGLFRRHLKAGNDFENICFYDTDGKM